MVRMGVRLCRQETNDDLHLAVLGVEISSFVEGLTFSAKEGMPLCINISWHSNSCGGTKIKSSHASEACRYQHRQTEEGENSCSPPSVLTPRA